MERQKKIVILITFDFWKFWIRLPYDNATRAEAARILLVCKWVFQTEVSRGPIKLCLAIEC